MNTENLHNYLLMFPCCKCIASVGYSMIECITKYIMEWMHYKNLYGYMTQFTIAGRSRMRYRVTLAELWVSYVALFLSEETGNRHIALSLNTQEKRQSNASSTCHNKWNLYILSNYPTEQQSFQPWCVYEHILYRPTLVNDPEDIWSELLLHWVEKCRWRMFTQRSFNQDDQLLQKNSPFITLKW